MGNLDWAIGPLLRPAYADDYYLYPEGLDCGVG